MAWSIERELLLPYLSLASQTFFPVLVGVAGSAAGKKGLVSLGHSLLQRGISLVPRLSPGTTTMNSKDLGGGEPGTLSHVMQRNKRHGYINR